MKIHTGRKTGGDTTETEGPYVDPPVTDRDLGTDQGRKGGKTDAGHGGGSRNAERFVETSGGCWSGWGRSPGEQKSTLGEDVGSG